MIILGDFGDTIFHLPKKRKKDLNLHSEAERKEAVYQLFIVVLSLLFRCSLYRFFLLRSFVTAAEYQIRQNIKLANWKVNCVSTISS